jgi:hypothetical protein
VDVPRHLDLVLLVVLQLSFKLRAGSARPLWRSRHAYGLGFLLVLGALFLLGFCLVPAHASFISPKAKSPIYTGDRGPFFSYAER